MNRYDLSLGIDQEIHRDLLNTVEFRYHLVFFAGERRYLRPRKSIFNNGRHPGFTIAWFFERYAEHGEALFFILFISLDNVLVFCAAGNAPGSPEIKQHIFSFKGG